MFKSIYRLRGESENTAWNLFIEEGGCTLIADKKVLSWSRNVHWVTDTLDFIIPLFSPGPSNGWINTLELRIMIQWNSASLHNTSISL
jgi:hypothetical protein